jgi:hypothetical protein
MVSRGKRKKKTTEPQQIAIPILTPRKAFQPKKI